MKNIVMYKLDKGGWAVALNPTNACVIWHFDKKKQATEKVKELKMVVQTSFKYVNCE